MHMVRCWSSLYKKDPSDYKPMRRGAYSDAMHMVRCCSSLYEKDQSEYKTMRCGTCGPMLFFFRLQKKAHGPSSDQTIAQFQKPLP